MLTVAYKIKQKAILFLVLCRVIYNGVKCIARFFPKAPTFKDDMNDKILSIPVNVYAKCAPKSTFNFCF